MPKGWFKYNVWLLASFTDLEQGREAERNSTTKPNDSDKLTTFAFILSMEWDKQQLAEPHNGRFIHVTGPC